MMSLTQFEQDMDGSMEPSDDGRWVYYSDAAKRIEELEAKLATAVEALECCADADSHGQIDCIVEVALTKIKGDV